ncbi:MAG: CDP-alcohol phosphatidyltransferase family protein [Polyangiaceae bacterium]
MARHFSMIRDFRAADFLTLGNGFSGTGAILVVLKSLVTTNRSLLVYAFALLPVALVCDVADGRVARIRHESSPLGQELDSLADLVSFGVAPAVLGFALGLSGGWDSLILAYFVACGISRLARYNATAASLSDESGKVRYFEGTPIPTSLLIVLVWFVLFQRGQVGEAVPFGTLSLGPADLHPFVLIYLLSGSAMISKTLRIPKPLLIAIRSLDRGDIYANNPRRARAHFGDLGLRHGATPRSFLCSLKCLRVLLDIDRVERDVSLAQSTFERLARTAPRRVVDDDLRGAARRQSNLGHPCFRSSRFGDRDSKRDQRDHDTCKHQPQRANPRRTRCNEGSFALAHRQSEMHFFTRSPQRATHLSWVHAVAQRVNVSPQSRTHS